MLPLLCPGSRSNSVVVWFTHPSLTPLAKALNLTQLKRTQLDLLPHPEIPSVDLDPVCCATRHVHQCDVGRCN